MRAAALLLGTAAAALPALASGCATKVTPPVGEIVLVVQTDLALPKDIDTIRIAVSIAGVPKFQNDYEKLGTADGQIKLPGTLGLLASDNPSDAVDVVVSARRGGKDSTDLRVVNELITTIPAGTTATMQVPIQFLCEGTGVVGSDGSDQSSCAAGETCLAGSCQSNTVESSTLPAYDQTQVFGDGSCFDVSTCFDDSTAATVDMTTCTITGAGPDVNIGLETEGDGICGAAGCFVALDAQSSLGWTIDAGGTIHLPVGVCTRLPMATPILDVVQAPVTSACPQKHVNLPTCGPWSTSVSTTPAVAGPVVLAEGLPNPAALALESGNLFWINTGMGGPMDGSVDTVLTTGGTTTPLASMFSPRDIAVVPTMTGTLLLWTSSVTGGMQTGAVTEWTNGSPPVTTTLTSKLESPEGITSALSGINTEIFWTDYLSGSIFQGVPNGPGMITAKSIAQGNYPYHVAADQQFVYWTNEGTAATMPPNGSVSSLDYTSMTATPTALAANQDTPREIALAVTTDAQGHASATSVYWATFVDDGAITRVDLTPAPGPPVVMASGLAFPNGIAVDATYVYWSNRNAGTIMSLPLKATPGTAPTVLATNQQAPGEMAVDATAVYWINGGNTAKTNGSIVSLAKATTAASP
jgi:hypothetical protein